ncbi:tRNA (guanine-N7-)-methyltransferase [Desulfobacula phenolica]|uniref:tRNA (guanine(46)-N(7))-methyltransferase n=2 Tax=Desulfobacula phenolica TaxID=90732 RepID=A0A1H2JR16_9BACT|nr:tRNA (guanine-N7-)-methyltransferase [Desulfobacula phenolica]
MLTRFFTKVPCTDNRQTKIIIMAKNKLHRYERVKHLPNVTFSVFGDSRLPCTYPWYDERYKGMERILELGCGKGEHSLAFAAANPLKLCVGIDSKSHRICVGAEKAVAECLENVLFLRVRIERIKEFFAENSIHEIWLTFPDPHLKNRAIKSRLSAPLFLDLYAHLLVPGGIVHLKTDSDLFYDYTGKSVEQFGGRVVAASDNIHATDCNLPGARDIVSAFENTALSKGLNIKYMAFTLN